MKNPRIHPLLLAATLALPGFTTLTAQQQNLPLKEHPAYLPIEEAIDLSAVKTAVNVNLPRFLINSALSEFNGQHNDPLSALGLNLRELTQDVRLIRVVVIEADEKTKPIVAQGIADLRSHLDNAWIPIVSLPNDNVFIYACSDETGEEMIGLTLLIADRSETVIGNLVGTVPLGKIARIAAQMGNNMVPHDLLQTLEALADGHSIDQAPHGPPPAPPAAPHGHDAAEVHAEVEHSSDDHGEESSDANERLNADDSAAPSRR